MDEQNQDESSKKSPADSTITEPVRSRWTPKPEQILILESIFNSGMVNPPKEETVRIRKLLEKFGAVGDANVFYWFQNRRSRSRRRQRQLQAGLAVDPRSAATSQVAGVGYSVPHDQAISSSSSGASPHGYYSSSGGLFPSSSNYAPSSSSSSSSPSSSSSYGFVADERVDDIFSSFSGSMGFAKNNFEGSSDASLLQYQPGTITVFINGVLTEVPRGAFDLRAMFGQNVMLVHSSGELVPVNEYGVLMNSLQMGESYFLVSSST